MDHLRAKLLRQGDDQLIFAVGFTRVTDQAAEAYLAGFGVLHDPFGDIVGGIHRHHLAGADDVDLLGFVFADRHGEAAADHVAEDVIEDEIQIFFIGAFFLEEVDGGDHPASGAADAWLRAAGFGATDIAIADLQNVFELQILDRAHFRRHLHDGVLGFSVKDQTGGVCFRIAADDHHFLTHLGEGRDEILGGGGFTDTAFTVDSALTHGHGDFSCC